MIDNIATPYFSNWSLPKSLKIRIYTDDTAEGELLALLTNEEIKTESMLLRESINDSDNLEFVGCIPTRFEITFFDTNGIADTLKDKPINLVIEIPIQGDDDYPIPVFSGYIDSCIAETTDGFYKITAYDYLYKMSTTDVSDWYAALSDSFTVKTFRDGLATLLGMTQVTRTLPNDNITVNKAPGTVTLTALDALKAICQINGVFGKMQYAESDTIFDVGNLDYLTVNSQSQSTAAIGEGYQKLDTEVFNIHRINTVIVRRNDAESYPGTATNKQQGEAENTYIIQGNILLRNLYGVDDTQQAILASIASNLLTQVNRLPLYSPFSTTTIGYPTVECGDLITFSKDVGGVSTTISCTPFTHTIKGIQAIKSEFSAKGEQFQTLLLSDLSQDISDIAQQTQENTQWINAADNGTNEKFNNTVNREAKKAAASVITQSSDTMIESLITNVLSFALKPNITGNGDNWEWSAGHDIKTFNTTSTTAFRNYINIAETTAKQLYEDLVSPADRSNIAESDTTMLTINGNQVYFTSLSNLNASFTTISPKVNNPALSAYIEDMYKVRRLKSVGNGTWLWNTFATVTSGGIDTGITFGDVAEVHYKETAIDKYLDVRLADTNAVYRGIRIKEDGVYYTNDGITYHKLGEGGGSDSPIGKVKIIDHDITASDIEAAYNVYVAYDPTLTPYLQTTDDNIFGIPADLSHGYGAFVKRQKPVVPPEIPEYPAVGSNDALSIVGGTEVYANSETQYTVGNNGYGASDDIYPITDPALWNWSLDNPNNVPNVQLTAGGKLIIGNVSFDYFESEISITAELKTDPTITATASIYLWGLDPYSKEPTTFGMGISPTPPTYITDNVKYRCISQGNVQLDGSSYAPLATPATYEFYLKDPQNNIVPLPNDDLITYVPYGCLVYINYDGFKAYTSGGSYTYDRYSVWVKATSVFVPTLTSEVSLGTLNFD